MRDLMHVHSFSYDFHLRVVHQYLLGSHMALRQGYHLTSFLQDFIAYHPDIPKFGRNHVFQGERGGCGVGGIPGPCAPAPSTCRTSTWLGPGRGTAPSWIFPPVWNNGTIGTMPLLLAVSGPARPGLCTCP